MIDGLKPYPAVKDSGVSWLGEVPAHWEVRRLKQICRMDYGDSLVADVRRDGSVPVFGSNGCVGFHDVANTNAPCVIVGRKGSFGKVHHSQVPAFAIDTTFFIDSRATSAHIRWLFYLLGWLRLDEVTKDSAVPGLDREEAYQRLGPVPPPPEQAAIVRFLDHADRRIRRYIRAEEKLIALLEEQKQAIIHQAVTGRIDVRTGQPYPAYKPSGVEWLGDVPTHWQVKKLTQIARQETGHTPSRKVAAYWKPEECTIPWLSLSDVWQLRVGKVHIYATKEKVSEIGLANSAARLLPKGTVVLSRTASVGFPAILGVPMATTQDFGAWICGKELRSEFLYFVLCAMKSEFRRLMTGSTHQTIYMPDIRAFRTSLPSASEQDNICSALDSALQIVYSRSEAAEDSINLIREYRTRLIADVVTGRLDVREAAAALPEVDPLAADDEAGEPLDAGAAPAYDDDQEPAEVMV